MLYDHLTIRKKSALFLRTSFVTLAFVASLPAQAQVSTAADDSAAPAEEEATTTADIVITGSRIRRTGYDTVQPTTVLSAATIEQRAATSVGEVLNEMPSFGVPGQTPVGSSNSVGRVTAGQSFVNFFGLGSQRSLTLINGMRFPGANVPSANGSAPGQQVDLNMIPTALIDRVETIAVGGAPIYGADAIAGTVNIILKKKFTGFDATIMSGIAEQGDAAKFRAQALYGLDFNDGRGNIVFNAEYNRQDGLTQADRALTAEQISFQAPAASTNSPFRNVAVSNLRVATTNNNGIILVRRANVTANGGARDTAGNLLQFSPTGDIIPYDIGTRIGGAVYSTGGDGANLAPTATLLSQSERYLGNIFANYDFSSSLRLHLEGWFSRTEAVNLANQYDYNSLIFAGAGDRDSRFNNGPYAIRLDNPFLTAAARATLARATDLNNDGIPDAVLDMNNDGVRETQGFYLDKTAYFLEGSRPAYSNQTLYRFSGALEGDFNIGGKKFDWSVAAAYGATNSDFREQATLIDRLNQAVDAVMGPNGQITCRDTSNGCVPLNVFLGSASQAATAFVTADITSKTKITQTVVSANITGALFTLPGGDVSIATGVDYRKETSAFTPDYLSMSGQARGFPTSSVSGSYVSKEIYGETLIPLVSADMDIPLISKLSVEGALRYVDNSLAGGDITWTAGGRWSPIPDIELRGNYTRSIRAPAITELFLPNSQILAFANDPCDARYITSGVNPSRRAANCAAAGISQPFVSEIATASKLVNIQGNQNLKNEEARSWTAGTILSPRFLPGFVASVDWVNIELTNSIENLNATTLLQSCYDSASFPTADVCRQFTRTATGQIATVTTGYVNAGFVKFAGLTANVSYTFGIGNAGRIALNANYQYTDKLDFSVTGTDLTRQAGQIGNSKNRGSASMTWTKDGFSLFGQGIFIGKARFNNADAPDTRDISGVGNWTVFNSAIGYDVQKNLELRLTVSNLFDRGAPRYSVLGTSGSGISTYFAGLLGRSYALSARIHF